MAFEQQIKRSIFVSVCSCGNRDVRTDDPPKERLCPDCGSWAGYKEEAYTGPELGK